MSAQSFWDAAAPLIAVTEKRPFLVDGSNTNTNTSSNTAWICDVHPRLELVKIPGSGLGYRVATDSGGSIKKGEVLLTETAFCAGKLSADSTDGAIVSQFIAQVRSNSHSHAYKGNPNMSVATLTTGATSGDNIDSKYSNHNDMLCHDRAWVQSCLDNNMYQCRREPHFAALFVALSRFNHSCIPNAINDASCNMARVRAVQPIQEGEQVNMSYVPVGHDLARRTKALDSFGFCCACLRCVRERACDPSCEKTCWDTDDSDNVVERHVAVSAASTALQERDSNDPDRRGVLQRLAETTLLLAPFATHPDTIQLHRDLVQLLTCDTRQQRSMEISKKSSNNKSSSVMLEQLREIKRLDQAHGGAMHRDLNFLRCFARLAKLCDAKGCCKDDDHDDGFLMLQQHVKARWADLCLLHFGERTAPITFMADTDDDVQYVPIGCGGELLVLFNADNEIDLSGHEIGDVGCAVLCTVLSEVSSLCVLDLDSNELSSVGATTLGASIAAGATPLLAHLDLRFNSIGSAGACALAAAIATGATPLLAHLDLMCNNIGNTGVCALAAALETPSCSLFNYLDLHGNGIGDDGCAALAAAFAGGGRLVHLDLSTNDIDDRGCAALSLLFRGGNRKLAHLDLSENYIESCSLLFRSTDGKEGSEAVLTSALQYLNVSWNCIADFEALRTVLIDTQCCTALASLRVEGNALSDRECNLFYATLRASGATPMLEFEEEVDVADLACEEKNDELCLQQCLRSLADGETINPRVCSEDIWQNNNGATTTVCTTTITQDSASASHLQDLLERDGFFVVPRLFPQWCSGGAANEYSMEAFASTMDRLNLAGWPPVFCFMCDAVWDLISTRLWDEMRTLLGEDCVLEPSYFAWSLKPAASSESDGQIGQSFGLPHRDYPASEALFDDGKTPKLLNVWIPVNDATLQNGCMYIVPREFDENFARPEEQAHMRSATTVRGTGACKLRFALHGARALPAQAGSLLAWCGNTIHWGASCSQYSASPPRKSIAMTFRRRSVAQLEGSGAPITQECARTMSLNMRLALISRSLLLYNQWHMLKGTAVPSLIYEATSCL